MHLVVVWAGRCSRLSFAPPPGVRVSPSFTTIVISVARTILPAPVPTIPYALLSACQQQFRSADLECCAATSTYNTHIHTHIRREERICISYGYSTFITLKSGYKLKKRSSDGGSAKPSRMMTDGLARSDCRSIRTQCTRDPNEMELKI